MIDDYHYDCKECGTAQNHACDVCHKLTRDSCDACGTYKCDTCLPCKSSYHSLPIMDAALRVRHSN